MRLLPDSAGICFPTAHAALPRQPLGLWRAGSVGFRAFNPLLGGGHLEALWVIWVSYLPCALAIPSVVHGPAASDHLGVGAPAPDLLSQHLHIPGISR